MNKANQLYGQFMAAYAEANDPELLRLYQELDGKRLAKAKREEVEHLHRLVTNAIAFEAFYAKYHGKVFQATVDWFDNMRGEGMVTIDEDLRLPICACNIKGRKTWFAGTACVYYTKGQSVDIKITVQALHAIFAEGITPGTLDSEGWDRIKGQNLAFRCDDEGNAVTGLFA